MQNRSNLTYYSESLYLLAFIAFALDPQVFVDHLHLVSLYILALFLL